MKIIYGENEGQPKCPGYYRCVASRSPALVAGRVYYIGYDYLFDDDNLWVHGFGDRIHPRYGKWVESNKYI